PLRRPAEKNQGGRYAGEQEHAGKHAPQISASTRNGDTADDYRGNRAEFQARAGLGVNVGKADGVEHGGDPGEQGEEDKHPKSNPAWPQSGQPGGFGIGADRINKTPAG